MSRTPKSGLLRKWILLPERKKLLLVGLASILCFVVFRSVFFSSPPPTYAVSHTLTQDERAELEEAIRAKLMREHEEEIERINQETNLQLDTLKQLFEEEMDKAETDEAIITDLKKNMTMLEEQAKTKTEAIKKTFEADFEGILSDEMAKRQKEIIMGRADDLLKWFCDSVDDSSALPVEEFSLDLGEQPCIGVASSSDKAFEVKRYRMTSSDVAHTVAVQAVQSLKNRTDVGALWQYNKLAEAQYQLKTDDRCCDSFVFSVHPVFGVFYKLRLPLIEAEGVTDTHFTRQICYRRKFVPRPVVKPFTVYSKVDHLLHPEQLLDERGKRKLAVETITNSVDASVDAVADANDNNNANANANNNQARQLASKKTKADDEFVPGTIHVILPFRASRLNLLPSLIKNLGRVKSLGATRNALPFRLIIAPVSWENEALPDAKTRVEAIVKEASAALNLDILISEPVPEADMTKTAVIDLLREWIDTGRKGVRPFSENADPAAAGILPNPWFAAVLGALKHVTRVRAPVLILDSATYSIPDDLVAKTRWRVVNGRMVYSPVVSSLGAAVDSPKLLSDGGASATLDELAEAGRTEEFQSKSFWEDVEDMNLLMDGDYEEFGQRRRLRAVPAATVLSKTANNKRKLLEVTEDQAAVAGEDETAPDDADLYDPYQTDQYGDLYEDYLPLEEAMEEEVEGELDYLNEFSAYEYDPYYENPDEDGYGLGYGFRDDDAQHAYLGGDEYDYFSYDGYTAMEAAVPLHDRVTTLGASKSDVAGMMFRMLETKPIARDEPLATPQAENCLLRRMLSVARHNKYRIVRTVVSDLYVDAMSPAGMRSTEPEVYPCECEYSKKARFCNLVMSQTGVDNPVDNTRVNCVLTSLLAKAHADKGVKKDKKGDMSIADVVRVTHAVRFFKPSKGIEIVAKVVNKAQLGPSSRLLKAASAPQPHGPEVFSFQWKLSKKLRMRDDVE